MSQSEGVSEFLPVKVEQPVRAGPLGPGKLPNLARCRLQISGVNGPLFDDVLGLR